MTVAEGHNVEVLCWFINDDLEKIFSVEIKSTQTIAALRSKIKEENPRRLAQFDASSLTLWKVDIDLNDVNLSSLQSLVIKDGFKAFTKLLPWRQVGEIGHSLHPSVCKLLFNYQPLPVVSTRNQRAWTIIRSPQNVEALRNAALNLVAGIAALYFIVKSLQASSAQAYASLLADNIPEFNVGFITNVSKKDNLMAMADMMNYHSANFVAIFTAANLFLIFFCLFVAHFLVQGDR